MDFYEKNNRLPELNNLEEAADITQKTLELYNELKKKKKQIGFVMQWILMKKYQQIFQNGQKQKYLV